MKQASGWRWAVQGIRRRIVWAAACYQSARTTFEVVRLLDRERQLLTPAPVRLPQQFVARPGYII
ncbi:MAG: hypothetical protein DMF78_25325 [Acidobacteria bacterium]|nr:MAG: hypothetical protein DMF78_25325 [Acidobacteriota bacterium]